MLNKLRGLWNHRIIQKVRHWANILYDVSWNVILLSTITILLIGFLAAGVGVGYFAALVRDMPVPDQGTMQKQINTYTSTSDIYFSGGEKIGNYTTDEVRIPIALKEVSPYVINALLATEDVEFYEHHGVVPKATFRAIIQEISGSEDRTGGSTLTQQLIKNQILTNEVSFERKAKEILLALRLEDSMSKDDILNSYLNVVSFGRNSTGRNISGIEAAAQGVFDTTATELTLPQAAFLAGIPKNPFLYTPYYQGGVVKEDLTASVNRMKTVLNRMYVADKITKKEYEEARDYDIAKDLMKTQKKTRDRYPYLLDLAEQESLDIITDYFLKQDGVKLSELKPSDRDEIRKTYAQRAHNSLRQGNYKIKLTIDKKVHESMQVPAKKDSNFGPNNNATVDPKKGPEQTAAVLLENKTGRVLGFVGGRYYNGKTDDFNRAFQMNRQIGSTAKPILVYPNAIEDGLITPETKILDEEYKYKRVPAKDSKTVKNEGNSYRGAVTIRDALKYSLNVPAVKVYEEHFKFKEDTQKLIDMGIPVREEDRYAPSMALGVAAVSPVNLAAAYAMIANYGEHVTPYIIEKIEYKDETIFEAKPKKKRIYEERTAYLVLDMLRDVYKSGTASYANYLLKVPGDWMGKTGTTQDVRDSYLVGSTPKVTLAVWTGYDKEARLSDGWQYGRYYQRTQGMWAQIANNVYKVKPAVFGTKPFQQPSSVKAKDFTDSGSFTEKDKKEKKKKEDNKDSKRESGASTENTTNRNDSNSRPSTSNNSNSNTSTGSSDNNSSSSNTDTDSGATNDNSNSGSGTDSGSSDPSTGTDTGTNSGTDSGGTSEGGGSDQGSDSGNTDSGTGETRPDPDGGSDGDTIE